MRLFFLWLITAAALLTQGVSAAGELEERALLAGMARDAFLHEDFAKLEQWAETYRREKSRLPSGVWKLTVFYSGILKTNWAMFRANGIEGGFALQQARLGRWLKLYPTSPSANILQGLLYYSRGSEYRGSGYASTVTPEGWQQLSVNMALAHRTLDMIKPIAQRDPVWYGAMLKVARYEDWDRETFDALLDEALGSEPLFYQNYFDALEYLLPKWHGSKKDVNVFVMNALRRTSALEGQGMYARIYWYMSQTQSGAKLFSDSFASWPMMKTSFDDVIARYPDAWNLSNFASFACIAKDKPKAKELFERIGATAIPSAWGGEQAYRLCLDWVGSSNAAAQAVGPGAPDPGSLVATPP